MTLDNLTLEQLEQIVSQYLVAMNKKVNKPANFMQINHVSSIIGKTNRP